ncbi:MAG: hypothetical protein JWQ09_654 [Segetibacter sp.]|nr:hypothetical protein [Segetibacter sp.]
MEHLNQQERSNNRAIFDMQKSVTDSELLV